MQASLHRAEKIIKHRMVGREMSFEGAGRRYLMEIDQITVKWRLSSFTSWLSNFHERKTRSETCMKCRFPGRGPEMVVH